MGFAYARFGKRSTENVKTVVDISARDALVTNEEIIVRVLDASASSETISGSAWYQWYDDINDYQMISETESNNIEQATETLKGIAELATQAESDAGTDDTRIITPLKLLANSKIASIETGATADQTDSEIETAYNNQVAIATANEMSTGTESAVRRLSPLLVSDSISEAISAGAGVALEEIAGSLNVKVDGSTIVVISDELSLSSAVIASQGESDAGIVADKFITPLTLKNNSKLLGIETGATADQTDAEIETAYNNQVAVVSQVDAEAGTSTVVKRWTPERVKQTVNANLTTNKVIRTDGSGNLSTTGASDLLAGTGLISATDQLLVNVDDTTISISGNEVIINDAWRRKVELSVITMSISTGDKSIDADAGYNLLNGNVLVRLSGVISQDTTITLPAIDSTVKQYTIKDSGANGESSPEYVLRVIPDGTDSCDSSDTSLTDEYLIERDNESVTFISNNSSKKWEAV